MVHRNAEQIECNACPILHSIFGRMFDSLPASRRAWKLRAAMSAAPRKIFPGATRIRFLLGLLIVMLPSSVSGAAYDNAFEAYQKGDYAAARKLLLPLASKGDA